MALFKKNKMITVPISALMTGGDYKPKALPALPALPPAPDSPQHRDEADALPTIPSGMFEKCPGCERILYAEDIVASLRVCACGHHLRLTARQRIAITADEGSFAELFAEVRGGNPLDFPGYDEKLKNTRALTGLEEAVVCGEASISGRRCALAVMDAGFIMGSMGAATGEKLALIAEHALEKRLPLIAFTASGGARMQEGMLSLMQMAKVSAAIARLDAARVPYIVVLTDPTTGGVTASLAMLGDVTLAEPRALVGFAGRRVIEQTIRQALPDGFQTAEFQQERGFVDAIVPRAELPGLLGKLLAAYAEAGAVPAEADGEACAELAPAQAPEPTPWERVQLARSPQRPTAMTYISVVFDDFIEWHGDRNVGDDAAIVGGMARLGGVPVMVIAEEKGETVQEKARRNFGSPHPEGYRKALRLMHQAEKWQWPVICLIDTQGAYCGIGAEERGQGEAIAHALRDMALLRVPIVSVVLGEGGSGGALALGVADRVAMLENAIYAILSPEGFASILWRDATRAQEAAGVMRITSRDLHAMGIVEDILPEPGGDAATDPHAMAQTLKRYLCRCMAELQALDGDERLERRYQRFRAMK